MSSKYENNYIVGIKLPKQSFDRELMTELTTVLAELVQLSLNEAVALLAENPRYLRYIQVDMIEIEILARNPRAIKYMQDLHVVEQIRAVESWPKSIKYIENPCEEVQLASVKKWPESIKYIQHPTVSVQKLAEGMSDQAERLGLALKTMKPRLREQENTMRGWKDNCRKAIANMP